MKVKKVICINNSIVKVNNLTFGKVYDISVDKVYDVMRILIREGNLNFYEIINDKGNVINYVEYRFISLKEYRKMKLMKLSVSECRL
jgi:hypothetical protein